jgi:hypothetical protein
MIEKTNEQIKTTEKKEKKNKKDTITNNKLLDGNIIRTASNNILESAEHYGFTNRILGLIYTYVHYVIILLVGFVFSFNNNVVHLCILLIIVSLDAFSIVVLHGCPLTHLEQKYLHTNSCEERSDFLKNIGIVYKCDHEYEKQIELLINIWTLIAGKCLLLLFFKTFHFKLHNYNNIYI